jgi:hypothetical protein
MTGQDGGFRAAVARFRADVEAALTRARRAAADAKEQSADFRRGTDDLARQARTGRRAVRRGQATDPAAREEAVKFRDANGLRIEELPEPDAEPRPEPPRREDEDFSQHTVLYDIDAKDEQAPAAPAVDQTSDESAGRRIDSPTAPASRPADDNDDFSQQRILFDATVESYRPEPLPDSVFEPSDKKNPS